MSFLRTKTELLTRSATDIVILSALRTPITRAHRGLLRNAYPEELLASVLTATRASLPPELLQVDDVTVGVVLSVLGGSKAARMALARAGFDAERTTLRTVNRACASSLEAVAAVAAQIRDGGLGVDVGIAAGMESMTKNYGSRAIPRDVWPELRGGDDGSDMEKHPVDWQRDDVGDCLMPMGLTAEIIARRYGISREEQDVLAVESHRRAAAARADGAFDAEIAPVTTRPPPPHGPPSSSSPLSSPPSSSSPETITVTQDDGIRPNLTTKTLSLLPPAFLPSHLGPTCTAGNSSPLSDGASAVLLTRRSHAHAHNLQDRILGRFVAAATAGCPPREMGIGPVVAVPRLLARLGLDVGDVHRWEVNEAFASQTLCCLQKLGLDYDSVGGGGRGGRVNPDGGAIALGHPLGATGARLVATLLHGLRREGRGEVGVVTLCVGTGMGQAALFVAE